jgi:hypothetical protein
MRLVVCSLTQASSIVVALEAPQDAPVVSGAAVCAVAAVGVRHEAYSEVTAPCHLQGTMAALRWVLSTLCMYLYHFID